MSKQAYYRRQFLNNEEHGGIAFVEASISNPSTSEHNPGHFDATFRVADCSRMVDLDFGCWDKDDVPRLRQKIALLRRTIVAFEAVLLTQLNEMEKT
jgi:hypothetical protein